MGGPGRDTWRGEGRGCGLPRLPLHAGGRGDGDGDGIRESAVQSWGVLTPRAGWGGVGVQHIEEKPPVMQRSNEMIAYYRIAGKGGWGMGDGMGAG